MTIVTLGMVSSGVVSLSTSVIACSWCATAAADAALPPIYLWAMLSTSWMLLTGGLAWWHEAKIPGHPRLVSTFVVMLLVALLALGVFGLGLGLLLFIPPATAFALSLFGSPTRYSSIFLRRRVRQLGVLAMIGVGAASLLSVYTRITRTPGEFIVQWDGTAIGRAFLSEPPDASRARDYRFVAQHGSEFIAPDAASRLAEVGDASDVMMLEDSLERARGEDWGESSRDQLEAAIERLRTRLEK